MTQEEKTQIEERIVEIMGYFEQSFSQRSESSEAVMERFLLGIV